MVELDPIDYHCILSWFERTWGKSKTDELPLQDRRTFWKLSFLCEDRLREMKETGEKEDL
tara:strand:- start:583 stop:762 length:180 start_codon:yes stop_codon:yes gene_type:complete